MIDNQQWFSITYAWKLCVWHSLPIANSSLNIFKCFFTTEKFCILVQISLNFVPKGLIDNKLVQVMAWHQTGDKPLPELMMTQFTDAYMR